MIRLIGEFFKLCKEDEDYEMYKAIGYDEDEESYSLHINFDLDGAKTLKSKFETALNEGKSTITVDENSFLEEGKTINELVIISKTPPIDGEIYEFDYNSKTVTLKMINCVVDDCMHKFNDCIEGGEYFPDEICDADYKDTEISIYGVFKPEI
ncbi:hypothetical protein [Paraclostridium bifermentans]|uniref:hypothetical protein n=1 Tax=Paraclostridium bifermentans TaxID=1490 RepID=UPI0011DCEF7F|nr:hypothetical protein [Paraclostridium bifermentans]